MSFFRTHDMALAAFLVAMGHALQGVEYNEAGRRGDVVWCFAVVGDLGQLVDAFSSREARVEPIRFVTAFARVRKAMFAFKDGDGTHT